ncbi:von Willebrand factor type A domain-containing protein [Nocardiopsis sp. Huas11]|uniref:VWA domain-containing protein n=1 Tax=Nocardiopsis sp. Huas11 TaxID=2183912 RepID=UPI000EB1F372|nr:VWA domain-containing protein [Nocardiopsis sp. Huas11]RKS08165.1 von Willebrand factor type A domain-containing protein [Nocardiopsis sp. Huas11]
MSTAPPPPLSRLEVHQNPCLPEGAQDVHAIATVTVDAPAAAASSPAQVIVIDRSYSMNGDKIARAREAAVAAVDALRDGSRFAVVAGNGRAEQIYPRQPAALAEATPSSREAARGAILALRADGGTNLVTWLELASALLGAVAPDEVRHTTILTDGQGTLTDAVLRRCAGLFTCDCVGIGEDWSPDQLRRITTALSGTRHFVEDLDDLPGFFRRQAEQTQERGMADLTLLVKAPGQVRVRKVAQVYPTERELTAREGGGPVHEYPLGSWGSETRDYQLWFRVPPRQPGAEIRVAQVMLASGEGQELARGRVLAQWTADLALATAVDPKVEHYTGQLEQNGLIREGLAALETGQTREATAKLGRARELAVECGRDDLVTALERVVDQDPVTGTVRLRSRMSRADTLNLDVGTDRTTREMTPRRGE